MTNTLLMGGCLCGAVTYQTSPPIVQFYHCHCSRCRKASGTANTTHFYVNIENFVWISGEDNITCYKLPTAERFSSVFCKTCGSKVPHARDQKLMTIPAGSLDSIPDAKPNVHMFWDSRAAWGNFEEHLKKFSERPEDWPNTILNQHGDVEK